MCVLFNADWIKHRKLREKRQTHKELYKLYPEITPDLSRLLRQNDLRASS